MAKEVEKEVDKDVFKSCRDIRWEERQKAKRATKAKK